MIDDSTPLGRRASWFLDRCHEGVLQDEDIDAHFALDGVSRRGWQDIFGYARRPIDEVLSYDEIASDLCRLRVRSGDDVVVLRLAVTDQADGHRIRYGGFLPEARPADGVTIRDADERTDGPALADLERRCPVRTGNVAVAYDRGDDWFAQQRLMGSHLTAVAVLDSEIVGVYSESVRPLRVTGIGNLPTAYHFHLRVDERCRGKRILPALNAHLLERKIARHHPYPVAHGFVAVANETMIRAVPEEMLRRSAWSLGVERLVVDCAAAAGAPEGRPAVPGDAGRIAALLASSHSTEELAPRFDATRVASRLERSPQDLGWSDVLVGDAAVVGVWDQRLGVTHTADDGEVARQVRATVVDWGCAPHAEDELVGLLRAWCGRLAETGTTHLTIFTSAPSPNRRTLDALSPEVEPFLLTLNAPEPPDVRERGVYVDPLYF